LKAPIITAGAALFMLDAVLVALTWPLALWLTRPTMAALVAPPADLRALLYPAADLLMLYAMGLYRRDAVVATRKSLSRVPLVAGMGAVLVVGVAVLLPVLNSAWFARPKGADQTLMFALAIVCFTGCGFLARVALAALLHRRVLRRRLLVIGAGRRAWDLLQILHKEGGSPDYEITFLHHAALGEIEPRLAAHPAGRILPSDNFAVLQAADQVAADQVVVAPDDRRGMDLEQLLECKKAGYPVVQYLSFVEQEIRRVDVKRMELGWLLYSDGFYFGLVDRTLKRLFDLGISSVVLLLTAPALLAARVAIRAEDKGPVFYRQLRVTMGGESFRILKLRTMRVNAEAAGVAWAAAKDDRITRIGRLLRRTRIDELPQLINVLRGEMSFVGPRPERPEFVAELARQIPLYNERHMVKAGLTGWAQINYPYGASVDDARSKLSYDLYYVKNFSILFDVVILLQTLRVVLWPSGVR
jgi:sugar transferase (PEP-CTERM system associated)